MTTQTKLYAQMTVDEQLRYVTDLTQFVDEKLPRLEQIGDAWERADRKDMETGLALLAAFQFARDYVNRTLYSGDYARRVYRLRYYVDKIKQEIARSMTITGSDGKTYALVRPTVPQRRRGRPTKEESSLRRQGIEVPRPTDKGMEAQIKIAQLVGLDIRVAGDYSPREKNNAELAAERAEKKAAYDKQNPSLFAAAVPAGETAETAAAEPAPAPTDKAERAPVSAAAVAAGNAAEYRLHIDQKRAFLSPALQERADTIRGLRTTSAAAAERAKLLVEQGAAPDVVAPYAREAQESLEAYEAIYADIDNELGTLHYRLLNDRPYCERFCERFGYKSPDAINADLLHDLKLHYKKVQSPDFDLRIRTLIEQESPEYAAKLKAEQERKEKIEGILKYLKRQDKPATDTRVASMKKRLVELAELIGQEKAAPYQVYIDKAVEDNAKLNAEKAAKKAEKEAAKKADKE